MSMVFALVLLGCADDGSACERLAGRPEHYGSQALCEAGQEAALQSESALSADYPTIVSRCLRVGGGAAVAKAVVGARGRAEPAG